MLQCCSPTGSFWIWLLTHTLMPQRVINISSGVLWRNFKVRLMRGYDFRPVDLRPIARTGASRTGASKSADCPGECGLSPTKVKCRSLRSSVDPIFKKKIKGKHHRQPASPLFPGVCVSSRSVSSVRVQPTNRGKNNATQRHAMRRLNTRWSAMHTASVGLAEGWVGAHV